jgi:hypothetical protein
MSFAIWFLYTTFHSLKSFETSIFREETFLVSKASYFSGRSVFQSSFQQTEMPRNPNFEEKRKNSVSPLPPTEIRTVLSSRNTLGDQTPVYGCVVYQGISELGEKSNSTKMMNSTKAVFACGLYKMSYQQVNG